MEKVVARFRETESLNSGEFELTAAELAENAEFICEAAKAGTITVSSGDMVIFPNNPGIRKPGDFVNSGTLTAVNGECFSSWVSDESTTRKGTRIFQGRDRIGVVEYLKLALEWLAAADILAEAKATAKTEAEVVASYFSGLPNEIGGFRRGHLGRNLEDAWGNYVATLPKKAALEAWPIKKLTAWVEEKTSGDWGE